MGPSPEGDREPVGDGRVAQGDEAAHEIAHALVGPRVVQPRELVARPRGFAARYQRPARATRYSAIASNIISTSGRTSCSTVHTVTSLRAPRRAGLWWSFGIRTRTRGAMGLVRR